MELIRISEHNGNQAVSARELHDFLEVGTKFQDWIERRILEYEFAENQDFEVFLKNEKNSNGGRPLKEYAISLDMAKELSMVERNEKGKQARKYFIECERRLRETPKPTLLLPIKEQRDLLLVELTELINTHLYKGDIQEIAVTYDVETSKIRRVLKGKNYEVNILKALYEKAMQNKALLKDGMQVMINNLKA